METASLPTAVAAPRWPFHTAERAARVPSRWLLGGAVLIAVAIRIAASYRSLWLDETISFLQANQPLGGVIESQVNGLHPPLYHVLLHYWMELFGTSAVAMRSLSVASSAAAVPAVWAWSRRAFPLSSPLPAAALAAIAPFAVWYGSEARMYAQMFALVSVVGWLTWRILDAETRWWSVFPLGLAGAALLYTHYFAGLYFVAVSPLLLALLIDREHRARAWRVLAGYALAVAAFLPWLGWLALHRVQGGDSPAYPVPDVFSALTAQLEMVIGFHSDPVNAALVACWPLLCLLAFALMPRMHRVGWRASGLFLLLFIPPAVLLAASALGPRSVFDPRYLTVCAPALYILLGRLWSLAPLRGALRVGCATALVGAGVGASVWQNVDPGNPKLFGLDQAIAEVRKDAAPRDAFVVAPDFETTLNPGERESPIFRYYDVASFTRPIADTSPLHAWRRAAAEDSKRVFLITSFENAKLNSGVAGALAFRRYFVEHGHLLWKKTFPQVTLTALRPPRANGEHR